MLTLNPQIYPWVQTEVAPPPATEANAAAHTLLGLSVAGLWLAGLVLILLLLVIFIPKLFREPRTPPARPRT